MENFKEFYNNIKDIRSESTEMWGNFLKEIGNNILNYDISSYESWSVISEEISK